MAEKKLQPAGRINHQNWHMEISWKCIQRSPIDFSLSVHAEGCVLLKYLLSCVDLHI